MPRDHDGEPIAARADSYPADTRPEPVAVVVCHLCGEPWSDHLALALGRWMHDNIAPHLPAHVVEADAPADRELDELVLSLDCLRLVDYRTNGGAS